jgi:hypothetical protein
MSNSSFAAVTPSDSVPLATPTRVFYIGTAGDVAVMGFQDTVATTFTAIPAGYFSFPSPVHFVMATDTTATFIVQSLTNSIRAA